MAREHDQEKAAVFLGYEPEWCEECSMKCEEEGMEYEFNWYEEYGTAYCEHCECPI